MNSGKNVTQVSGGSRDFEKGGGALYAGHHGWPMKKILVFKWSKKAKITLETKLLAKHFFQYFQIFSIFNIIKAY